MPPPAAYTFVGGPSGPWRVTRLAAVHGEGLSAVSRLTVVEGLVTSKPPEAGWMLRGVTSNERYTRKDEHDALAAHQFGLGRPEATEVALIPIRKNAEWWALSQDERRAIFEERSHHIATSLAYLPGIARRLHHSRDLGEPFDFVTWFEYAPNDSDAFEELLARLRATEEWAFVEWEVDIRMTRDAG